MPAGHDRPELELICPACGALVEGHGMDDLFEEARAHTLDAHNYDIPHDHVAQVAEPSSARQQA